MPPMSSPRSRRGARAGWARLTVALTAPDSMLAVVSRDRLDITGLRARVAGFSADTRVALGLSYATVSGDLVDGPALDVESWAPYPLRSEERRVGKECR